MKVYALPEELPAPKPDYANFNLAAETKKQEAHQGQVKAWLQANGYKGPLTGEIYTQHVADGSAIYMYGDAGTKSVLIHLPYFDGYQAQDIDYVPAKVVRERMAAQKGWAKRA